MASNNEIKPGESKLRLRQRTVKKDDNSLSADVTIIATSNKRNNLVKAILEANTRAVKKLIKDEKVDPNFQVDTELARPTPLILAAVVGDAKLVKYLLRAKDYPANVNVADKNGRTALWFAVETNNIEVAEALLKSSSLKCKVDYVDQNSGMSPLFLAVNMRLPEMCRVLIRGGASVNRRRVPHTLTDTDETPLIRAIQLDDIATVRVLLNSLVDRNVKTCKGFAALHYAVAYRRYEILELLLQQRTDVTIKTSKGVTSMTIAISENLPTMVRLLVEHKYKIEKKFDWGETPFDMAVRAHSEECAMVLVHCGYPITPVKDAAYFRQRKAHMKSIFYDVCDEGLLNLARLMIDVYPYFLQESWIRAHDFPLALYNNDKFVDKILEDCQTPFPLAKLCLSKIFILMRRRPYKKVKKLPLPESVKTWFAFNEHFLMSKIKKYFQKRTLFSSDCPVDCIHPCKKTQCPDVEFEDSGDEFEPGLEDLEEDDFIDLVSQMNFDIDKSEEQVSENS